jgi:putative membrane protein insertion efficiency factor
VRASVTATEPAQTGALALVNTALRRAALRLLLVLIRLYQLLLSPWLGGQCRYFPTCSAYAEEALRRFGVARGLALTLRRLGRCHPWGGSGYDPVPEAEKTVRPSPARRGEEAPRR